nr:putative coiled-coil domain-containing protein 195 [Chelonoidis abingdonii]
MERNTQLMRVIREMRSEINKLERENRALRVELKFSGQRAANWEEGASGEHGHEEARSLTGSGEERVTSPVALRRNVSASSALALQEQKGMIVRRYSISSSVQSFSGHKHHKAEKRHPSNRILEVQGIVKPPAGSSVMQLTNEEEKGSAKIPANCFSSNNSSKRRSFQEHVYKCK